MEASAQDALPVRRLLTQIGVQAGPWAAVLAVNALLLAAAELAFPAVLGGTIDALLSGSAGGSIITLTLVVTLLILGGGAEDWAVAGGTARSTARLRTRTLRHVLAVGYRGTSGFAPGDISARLVGNTAEAGSIAADVIRAGVTVLPAAGGTIALFLIDPWLGVTFLVGAPVLLIVLWVFARQAADLATHYLTAQGRIAARLGQARLGARTIATAGTADREIERVLAPLPELNRYGVGMWRAQSRITVQDMLILAGLEIAVLAVAGWELSRGRITPGELVAASQYVGLAATISAIAPSINRVARARAAATRLNELLTVTPTRYGTSSLPPQGGRLELRAVTVRRSDRHALDRVSVIIPAGAVVAVVGPSGSGKSLLAGLIARLSDPDQGEVLLDGVALTALSHDELRGAVGYAFARPTPLGGTLGQAIAFGSHGVQDRDIEAAARAARADSFIRRMPQGYDTPLGQAPMSGGELQRLGLARSFAHPGRVLVLDDVATSLDTVTEHEISQALLAMTGRTRVLVAHRASTAARADIVIWLDGGVLRAVAAHDKLWSDPDYRALYEATPDRAPAIAVAVSS